MMSDDERDDDLNPGDAEEAFDEADEDEEEIDDIEGPLNEFGDEEEI